VQFWTNGVGRFHTGKTLHVQVDDPVATPPFMESEVLSPFAQLQPGESARFETDWYTVRIGPNLPILDCTDVGVLCRRFAAAVHGKELTLTGNVGVFHVGKLGLALRDEEGRQLVETGPVLAVSPTRVVALSALARQIEVPANAHSVEIVLYHNGGQVLGRLAKSPLDR
jgi:hypothetical protein